MWSVCFQPLFCPACPWSQGALGWPCPMAGLSYCCCWLSGHRGGLYYLCRSLSSAFFMRSIAASHRPQSPVSATEAVSPAVTDRHSHSNSFTNIRHSFHTATTAGSHAGKIPLELHNRYAYTLSLWSAWNIKRFRCVDPKTFRYNHTFLVM